MTAAVFVDSGSSQYVSVIVFVLEDRDLDEVAERLRSFGDLRVEHITLGHAVACQIPRVALDQIAEIEGIEKIVQKNNSNHNSA